MPLKVYVTPVTPFEQNCSVIVCENTRLAAVVDPGGDLHRIRAVLEKAGAKLQKILLTHAHIDHAGATAELARESGVPIEGPHRGDEFWIEGLPEQSRMFGLASAERFTPDRWLNQGDTVQVGESSCRCCTARDTRRGTWCSTARRRGEHSAARCCSRDRRAAPTCLAAITDS